MDMIGFRSKLASFLKTLSSFIPAAQIHHGHAALIMILGSFGILIGKRLHALLGDAEMRARTIGKFFTGTGNDPFELLFGTLKFLLVEERHGFFIEFHLCLDERVHHFNTAALGRGSW